MVKDSLEETFNRLTPLVELPTLIQVQKNIDSLSILPSYFPNLGVVLLSESTTDENFLESSLVMNPADPINTTEVKNFIKRYFPKRQHFCVPNLDSQAA